MKRPLKRLCAALLTALLLIGGARAAEQASPAPTQEQLAQMLFELGLFRGTDQGFELERSMTRGEAAVMVTRFFGGAGTEPACAL